MRARATGILLKRLFEEGANVKEGDVLFEIDPAPLQASLNSAKATLAKYQAALKESKSKVERYRELVKIKAVSQQVYDEAEAALGQDEAEVLAAEATVQTAELNLGYTKVTAPISGRIGKALVTEGALVGQGSPTELAVIQQVDPLYINFTQSASDALKLRAAIQSGQYKQTGGMATVRVVLEDGSVYPEQGRLLFTDLSVDATSGQVTLRAEIPNPKRYLLPGLYVRVQLEQAQVGNAILLPQQAVTRSAGGDTVMVVDADNKVAPRTIKLGPAQGTNWVVLDGLKTGEQVMVDGFQKLPRAKPGTPIVVHPVAWQAAGGATSKTSSAKQ